ncbi:hypothetical protein NPIL_97061 [Nephila pilipes]|uniref:Uncharacterized protein n=1 Tax=Nephila pilipes TaxID=299642 RepID=A0A8X6PVB5_NEPPI|nr:hypothetical protein NPIL_97061 [Nephila pilipes]
MSSLASLIPAVKVRYVAFSPHIVVLLLDFELAGFKADVLHLKRFLVRMNILALETVYQMALFGVHYLPSSCPPPQSASLLKARYLCALHQSRMVLLSILSGLPFSSVVDFKCCRCCCVHLLYQMVDSGPSSALDQHVPIGIAE